MKKLSLEEVLKGVEDSRRSNSVIYPLHVVSVFAQEYGLILGQLACEEKSNEITAILKLLEILEIWVRRLKFQRKYARKMM